MATKRNKGVAPPRYNEAFKAGAVKLVTEQERPSRARYLHRHAAQLAQGVGQCENGAGGQAEPGNPAAVGAGNREVRTLHKQVAMKAEVIDIL